MTDFVTLRFLISPDLNEEENTQVGWSLISDIALNLPFPPLRFLVFWPADEQRQPPSQHRRSNLWLLTIRCIEKQSAILKGGYSERVSQAAALCASSRKPGESVPSLKRNSEQINSTHSWDLNTSLGEPGNKCFTQVLSSTVHGYIWKLSAQRGVINTGVLWSRNSCVAVHVIHRHVKLPHWICKFLCISNLENFKVKVNFCNL